VTLLTVDFEKTFLEHDAFPPDVSRGLDIASALLTVAPASSFEGVMPGQVLRLYSEPLLLLMPFPDGSMPFNVIAFSCTVLAFIFGSMFNLLFASDESVLRGKAKSPLKRAIAATIAKLKKKYGSTRSSTPRKVEDENSIRGASNPEDLQKSTKEQKPSHDAKTQDEPEHASDLSASPNKAGRAISPKSSITAAVFGIKATPSPPRNRRSSPRRQNAAAAAANPIE
jgi:phosphatidylinositol glycan class T